MEAKFNITIRGEDNELPQELQQEISSTEFWVETNLYEQYILYEKFALDDYMMKDDPNGSRNRVLWQPKNESRWIRIGHWKKADNEEKYPITIEIKWATIANVKVIIVFF